MCISFKNLEKKIIDKTTFDIKSFILGIVIATVLLFIAVFEDGVPASDVLRLFFLQIGYKKRVVVTLFFYTKFIYATFSKIIFHHHGLQLPTAIRAVLYSHCIRTEPRFFSVFRPSRVTITDGSMA